MAPDIGFFWKQVFSAIWNFWTPFYSCFPIEFYEWIFLNLFWKFLFKRVCRTFALLVCILLILTFAHACMYFWVKMCGFAWIMVAQYFPPKGISFFQDHLQQNYAHPKIIVFKSHFKAFEVLILRKMMPGWHSFWAADRGPYKLPRVGGQQMGCRCFVALWLLCAFDPSWARGFVPGPASRAVWKSPRRLWVLDGGSTK